MATAATTPSPAVLSLVTTTASSSSSPTGLNLATPGTASSSNPTPTTANPSTAVGSPEPSNWSEVILYNANSQVQSKDHPNYPNSPYQDLLTHGNNPKTRLLMISSNPQEDEKLKESIKNDPLKRANDVHITVLPLSSNAHFKKDEFISKVKRDHRPTMFAFKSKNKRFKEILKALKKNGLIRHQLTEAKDGNIFFEAKNILLKEQEPVVQAFSVVGTGRWVKETLKDVLKNNKNIANQQSTKVLIISGSHGSKVKDQTGKISAIDGKSGLSTEGHLNQKFYAEDCYSVGLKPIPSQFHAYTGTPGHIDGDFSQWFSAASFNRPSIHNPTLCTPLPADSLLNDPDMNKMQFQVVDLAWYHNHPDLRGNSSAAVAKRSREFVKDVVAFGPTIILLAYCFSSNGDISMALRSAGLFGVMILQYDLRFISQNNQARLDKSQEEALEQVCREDVRNVAFSGSHGVGKTLLGAAAVKYLAAFEKIKAPETNVEIIVVHMFAESNDAELLKVLKSKYFLGFEAYNIKFFYAGQMCDKLGVEHGIPGRDIGKIKAICKAKNKKNEEKESNGGGKTVSIFMFDELIQTAGDQKVVDCTGLGEVESFKTVRTVTCISPMVLAESDSDNVTVKLPKSPSFYSQCLTVGYRNARGIRLINNFLADHYHKYSIASRDNDSLGQYLPPGPAGKPDVTWLQVNKEEALGKAAKQKVQECGNENVVVLYEYKDDVTHAAAQESGASKIFDELEFIGCENQTVIVIMKNTFNIDVTSRAMNRLIMVTGPNLDIGVQRALNLAKEDQHVHTDQVFGSSSDVQNDQYMHVRCSENPCPWSNRDKYEFPLVEHVEFSSPPQVPQEYCNPTKRDKLSLGKSYEIKEHQSNNPVASSLYECPERQTSLHNYQTEKKQNNTFVRDFSDKDHHHKSISPPFSKLPQEDHSHEIKSEVSSSLELIGPLWPGKSKVFLQNNCKIKLLSIEESNTSLFFKAEYPTKEKTKNLIKIMKKNNIIPCGPIVHLFDLVTPNGKKPKGLKALLSLRHYLYLPEKSNLLTEEGTQMLNLISDKHFFIQFTEIDGHNFNFTKHEYKRENPHSADVEITSFSDWCFAGQDPCTHMFPMKMLLLRPIGSRCPHEYVQLYFVTACSKAWTEANEKLEMPWDDPAHREKAFQQKIKDNDRELTAEPLEMSVPSCHTKYAIEMGMQESVKDTDFKWTELGKFSIQTFLKSNFSGASIPINLPLKFPFPNCEEAEKYPYLRLLRPDNREEENGEPSLLFSDKGSPIFIPKKYNCQHDLSSDILAQNTVETPSFHPTTRVPAAVNSQSQQTMYRANPKQQTYQEPQQQTYPQQPQQQTYPQQQQMYPQLPQQQMYPQQPQQQMYLQQPQQQMYPQEQMYSQKTQQQYMYLQKPQQQEYLQQQQQQQKIQNQRGWGDNQQGQDEQFNITQSASGTTMHGQATGPDDAAVPPQGKLKYDKPIEELTKEDKNKFFDIISKGIGKASPGIDLELARKLETADSYNDRKIAHDIRYIPKQETVRKMLEEDWLGENGDNATIQSMLNVLKQIKQKLIVDKIKNNIPNY